MLEGGADDFGIVVFSLESGEDSFNIFVFRLKTAKWSHHSVYKHQFLIIHFQHTTIVALLIVAIEGATMLFIDGSWI